MTTTGGRQVISGSNVLKLTGGELYLRFPGTGIARVLSKTNQIKLRAGNMRPVFSEYSTYLLNRIEQAFIFQGLPTRWRPLSPAYAAQKAKDGYGSKGILERTGGLRRGFARRITPRTMKIYNRRRTANGVDLFKIHQFGTSTIPARPMIRNTRVEQQALRRIVGDHLGLELEL
jgi:phage gpG-like protein